jgi:hypothetical protein
LACVFTFLFFFSYVTPFLLQAARKGHVEVVKLLVDNGVSVNARTDFGKGQSVLNLAKDHHEEDSYFIRFLVEELGAMDIAEEDL